MDSAEISRISRVAFTDVVRGSPPPRPLPGEREVFAHVRIARQLTRSPSSRERASPRDRGAARGSRSPLAFGVPAGRRRGRLAIAAGAGARRRASPCAASPASSWPSRPRVDSSGISRGRGCRRDRGAREGARPVPAFRSPARRRRRSRWSVSRGCRPSRRTASPASPRPSRPLAQIERVRRRASRGRACSRDRGAAHVASASAVPRARAAPSSIPGRTTTRDSRRDCAKASVDLELRRGARRAGTWPHSLAARAAAPC